MAETEPATPSSGPQHWEVLGRLEKGPLGTRHPDRSVSVRRGEPAGCFLYGPYLHLPKGHYRLSFRCRGGRPGMAAQPVLGIEIIVLSRFQQLWRDYTAAELVGGAGWLDFEVLDEHSLESENEGRFEFRFFHLGNADLTVTAVELDRLSPDEMPLTRPVSRWRLLGRLQKSWLGSRDRTGSVSVGRLEPAGRLLYGGWPYLRLPRGSYRLEVRGHCAASIAPGAPVIGVEVFGQSRWQSRRNAMLLVRRPETNGEQLGWRDLTAAELAPGTAAIEFAVPVEMSMDAGADAPFDIRLHHLAGARLTIEAVDLIKLDDAAARFANPSAWRLLSDDSRRSPGILFRRTAPLRLPEGCHRLTLIGDADSCGPDDAPVLQVELAAKPWIAGKVRSVSRLPAVTGRAEASVDSRTGRASIEFEVPPELAGRHDEWQCVVTVRAASGTGFRLKAVEFSRILPGETEVEGGVCAPAIVRSHGRRKVVIIGNCQSETLRQGFARSETLNRLFDVKYHFIQLPKNLHEFAARDLESCDILLFQDIRLWDDFPLRDCVRPGADTAPFPLVRFASLWPFDSWNGPGDKEAYDREAPNLTFPYLDGLLGRARKEISDPAARFDAYRTLEMPGVVNYRRLHDMEVRRLGTMDKKFDCAIGSFILENFQSRRVFHTTVRPTWEVFSLMMQLVARQVGVTEPISLDPSIDLSLRNPQVPIHPKVARDLGVKWADEATLYLNRGIQVTWETYVRSYIEHYG